MADSNNPGSGAVPAASRPAAAPAGGPPAIDPVAVIRSKRYIGALVLAAIVGIPVSAVAYGFLAFVSAIQRFLFTELPNQMLGSPAPAWWPLPWLVLCGLLVAIDHPIPPGQRRTFARIWLSNRRRTGHGTRAARHNPCGLGHTQPRRSARARSTADRDRRRAWGTGRPPGEEGRATDGLDDHGVGRQLCGDQHTASAPRCSARS